MDRPSAEKRDSEDNEKRYSDLNERFEKYLKRGGSNRQAFERSWYRHAAYYAGSQWLFLDRADGQSYWRPKRLPKWFPTPVTNKIAEAVDDNVSSLIQDPVKIDWIPMTHDPADLASAEVASSIDDVIADEVGRVDSRREIATWAAVTGNAFLESFYDNSDKFGTVFMQYDQCTECGYADKPGEFTSEGVDSCPRCASDLIAPARKIKGMRCTTCDFEMEAGDPELSKQPCPQCLQIMQEFEVQQAVAVAIPDPEVAMQVAPQEPPQMGELRPLLSEEQLGEEVPRGRMRERVRSPFEVYFDYRNLKSFKDSSWVILRDMIDSETAKAEYDYDVEKDQGGSKEARPGDTGLVFLEALNQLIGGADSGSRANFGGGFAGLHTGGANSNRVVRDILYEIPCKDYEEGLYAVRLGGEGGTIVDEGPLPYEDASGAKIIPVVHAKFRSQPGRCYGKSPVQDLISLQDSRNQTESLLLSHMRRMSMGVWLVPRGMLESPVTGEPGEMVYYNSIGDGRVKPERVSGIEPPRILYQYIEILDSAIEKLSGGFGVAHGQAPSGVRAASALAFLGERQQRAMAPQVQAWEVACEQIAAQQMWIFRQFAVDPRTRVVGGPTNQWSIEVWSSSDLQGKIIPRVQRGSASPKSNAQQRASVEALVTMGILDVTNADVQYNILRLFGETDLVGQIDADRRDARAECDRFMRYTRGEEGGEPFYFRRDVDDHHAHLSAMLMLAKTGEFRDMEIRAARAESAGDENSIDALYVALFYAHMDQHKQTLAEEMEREMQQQMAMQQQTMQQPGQPGRPPGGGGVFNGGNEGGEDGTRAIAEPGSM